MRTIKESRWIYILLSVLIAITFWLFVRMGEDPELESRVRNIPVQVDGERFLEQQGLMVDQISTDGVTLVWKGKWQDISQLNKETVSVTVDVSRVAEPGEYELEYTPKYPASVTVSDLSLQEANPHTIKVKVSKIYSKTLKIEPEFIGGTAEGFQAGEIVIEPETVLISGVQEKVDGIQYVKAVLDRENLTESFSGEVELQFLNAAKEPVDTQGVRLSVERASAYLPIVAMKEVPLTLNILAGGGATASSINYEIEPKAIMVSGPKDLIDHMESIPLGTIDLAKVMDEEYYNEYTIPLYNTELVNVSGIQTAKVHLSIGDLQTQSIVVETIELENIPEGYKATLITKELPIILRGTPAGLEHAMLQQIRAVVDLSGVKATGSLQVPVKVYLFAGDDVGVIGDVVAVVKVTRG